jgi:DNA-binding PadR family transcriptional regulator
MCYDVLRYIVIQTKGDTVTAFAFTAPGARRRRDDRIQLMTAQHHPGRRRRRHPGPGGAFGRRAGRGDIRAAILALLAEEPMHGYQIIQELAERTGGVWRPSPGSVYPTLQQLEDEELVRETASDSGKRVYELTDAGREQASQAPAPWTAVAGEGDDGLVALRDLVQQVAAATRQVAHAGSPTQVETAQTVLRDARKSLYRLLAEDDE